MVHGFDIGEDLHGLLRGPVPRKALDWVERETHDRVVGQEPLEGGAAAATHRIRLERCNDLVIQRFVMDWIDEEPWVPADEAWALKHLGQTPVPSPQWVADDTDGHVTGTPTVLMTALPGEVVWDPPELDPWIDAMIGLLLLILDTEVADSMRTWEPYAPVNAPPDWTRHRWAWERALSVYHGQWPTSDHAFLHRDFHPGNILWVNGQVSGVVDWTSPCVGPPEQDVAHCRMNLARHHGQDVAERFLDRWLQVSGRTDYDPRWDLLDVVSLGSSPADERLDEFVAAAAARV